jgi:small-conductance mechanosensitive channel
MEQAESLLGRTGTLLNTGIGGTAFTPVKLLIVVLLLVALVWVTGRVTRWFVTQVLERRGLDVGLAETLGTLVRYGVIGIGLVVILQSAGVDLTALNVLMGALGVGLGFGLQNIASNFVSGIIILLERPVAVGDRIEIGGITGDVHAIGARATTLVTDESVAVIVPNSQLITERVKNWSRPAQLTAYSIAFQVSHSANVDAVREALIGAAADNPVVLKEPAPTIELTDAGLHGLRFVLQVWSSGSPRVAGTLKSDLNQAVCKKFAKRGIPWSTAAHLAPTSPMEAMPPATLS